MRIVPVTPLGSFLAARVSNNLLVEILTIEKKLALGYLLPSNKSLKARAEKYSRSFARSCGAKYGIDSRFEQPTARI